MTFVARERIVRLKLVLSRTGLSKSTIYRRAADGTFPPPVKLGARSSGWYESQLEQWLAAPAAYRAGSDIR
ncbi:AlpA family transcriptional regulator [Sphingopyxis sp.]|uniref:helix-turn-helix transcriptional regulator n=1 Tax=Sphingopyxis sp. TaxID=1908224 RepID=UPI002D7779BB|nr:AlpA family transcriptional regulator [Sphingopyxis sp.]HET6523588.1 AlpA family transcriptional regulator [Sphingopyxis sp.]